MSVYRLRGVCASLGGRQTLHDIDLDAVPGRVLALVGPNGAGKSTLLGVLGGDVPASAGTIEFDGRPLATWSPAHLAQRRAVLLQANQVSFPFTVQAVVEMGRTPWPASQQEDASAVADALRWADVEHLVDRPFSALSGGEKARVSLARVLAQRTPVVLLDEPTSALDLRHQEDVMSCARQLATAGRTVVVAVHDLSVAAAYADEITVIDDGRIVAHGPPSTVITPETIARTYGIDVHVVSDPDGNLAVIPKRGADSPTDTRFRSPR